MIEGYHNMLNNFFKAKTLNLYILFFYKWKDDLFNQNKILMSVTCNC